MKKTAPIKWVIIFLILSGFISLASAFDVSQLQWRQGISGKLLRGEEITYMGYSIKVIAFPSPVEAEKYSEIPSEPVEPFVGLNISKNGSFINTTVLGLGDSYIVPDGELKVTATQLPSKSAKEWLFERYNPWAMIELNPRGIPHIEVSVKTDYNEYISLPATEIVATVTLKNTGSADAVNVDMHIDTELPVKRGSSKYHYERVRKEESITNTITFASPVITEKKSYGISANLSGYDVKDISYTAKFLNTILIVPEPQQIPNLKKSINARIYLKDYAMVSLSLKNNGKYDLKNVSITDSLPKGFKLMGNNSLHWVVDIPANGEWDSRYLIKPQESNKDGTVLPAATAEFLMKNEYYIIQSNRPEIVVYGPKVVLNKQTDVSEIKPGDTVTVTVTAENTGSTPTKVFIRDELPKGATIVSGSTAYEEYIEANKKVSFSYTLKIDSEPPIKLPPASAEYYELGTKGGKISTMSKEVEIRIKALSKISEDVPTPVITTPAPTPVTPVTPVMTVIESDNSTSSNVVNGMDEPLSDKPRVELPDEVYALLNFMLGCNENSTDNSRSDAAYNACKFFEHKKV